MVIEVTPDPQQQTLECQANRCDSIRWTAGCERTGTIARRTALMTAINAHTARLVIHEGRYYQVRRMFAACGNHVTDLHRSAIGALELPGDWRIATTDEIRAAGGR